MGTHAEPIKLPDDFEATLAALLAVRPEGFDEPLPAADVAAALITRRPGLSQMQLHKLLYMAQAAHLVWYGSPAFRERIEAWTYGPMVRRIAGHYKQFGEGPINAPASGRADAITDRVALVLGRVIDMFGHLTGSQLADLVKVEGSPWRQVWGDLPDDAKSQREIPLLLISDYYREHGFERSDPTDEQSELIRRFLIDDELEALHELFRSVS